MPSQVMTLPAGTPINVDGLLETWGSNFTGAVNRAVPAAPASYDHGDAIIEGILGSQGLTGIIGSVSIAVTAVLSHIHTDGGWFDGFSANVNVRCPGEAIETNLLWTGWPGAPSKVTFSGTRTYTSYALLGQDITALDTTVIRVAPRVVASQGATPADTISITISSVVVTVNYTVPLPVITSVTPNNGTAGGGTDVIVEGTDLDDGSFGATVKFDGNLATNKLVISSTKITCKTPPGYIGLVNVTVTNPTLGDGTLVNGYEYTSTVLSAQPNMGEVIGGTLVNIRGTGFAGLGVLTNVIFDLLPATEILVLDDSNLVCRTPPRVNILPVWVVVTAEFDSITTVPSATDIYLYEDIVKDYSIDGDEITIEFNTIDPITITNINVGVPVLVWTIINSTTVSFKFIPGNWWVIITFNIYPLPLYLFQTPFTMVGSGGIEFDGTNDIVVTQDLSGIYTLVPNKTTDTYYDRLTGQPTVVTEIPDPMFKTGYIGG